MKTKDQVQKEKEREIKLKELRKDLEEKLIEQLPEELIDSKIRVEIQKIDEGQPLDPEQAKGVVEALLFASSKPMTVAEIKKTVKSLTAKDIQGIIEALRQDYEASSRSFQILEIAGGYEISTRKEFAPWICKVELQRKAKQATQSALETLAIMAYKQPITRAEVESLRGVDVSGVLSTLMTRGFIKIAGKKEIPGRPFLYATTEKFLEHFGLKSLKDLPDIEEIKQLVEGAVKKEELLGRQNIVEASPESEEEPAAEASENSEEIVTESDDDSEILTEHESTEINETEEEERKDLE